MTDHKNSPRKTGKTAPSRRLELEYSLDAPCEKVWRAISIAEIRESWLPGANLRHAKPVQHIAGEEITYQMRDTAPPYLESTVTFRLIPTGDNSTQLRIIHDLTDARCAPAPKAANSNTPEMMRAA
ncbi:SRPBCC domain-containing protein [Thalassospira profundimaris]|uniref:SRPBCC family protein n=1 Tax=Thalassospira profundimaris TaxID=502049 RepID=UPI000DEDA759|nr:SRPBCC domain-containing protein [Thalassospira profundimaris]